jgi:hypothetical protein
MTALRPSLRSLLPTATAILLLALPAAAQASTPDHLVVSVSPAKSTLGQAVTVTAVVKDATGATVSDYSGPANWRDLFGALDASSPADFAGGISRTKELLTKPVNGDVIFLDTAGVTGESGHFTAVGPVDHFDVQMPASVPSASPVAVKAIARDSAGNLVSGFAGTAAVQDRAGVLAAPAAVTFSGGTGQATLQFSGPTSSDQLLLAAGAAAGMSRQFKVVGPIDHIDVSLSSSATTASPFTVTARARDALGDLVTSFNGPASWTDRSSALQPAAPSDFVAGVSTTTVTAPKPFHADLITVTSSAVTGSSKPFNVVGPFDHMDFSRLASTMYTGTSVQLTAYARDAANNLVPGYAGAAEWSSGYDRGNGGSFPRFVGGVSRTMAQLSTPEHQSPWILTADPVPGNVLAVQATLTQPIDIIGPVDHYQLTWTRTDGLAGCSSVTGSLLAKALDTAGNVVKNYQESRLFWWPAPDETIIAGTTTPEVPAPFVNGVSWSPRLSWSGFTMIADSGMSIELVVEQTLDPATNPTVDTVAC